MSKFSLLKPVGGTRDLKGNICFAIHPRSNEGIVETMAPFLGVSLSNTLVDWNYTTVPQEGYNNRTLGLTRGYVLGGSSTVSQYSLRIL